MGSICGLGIIGVENKDVGLVGLIGGLIEWGGRDAIFTQENRHCGESSPWGIKATTSQSRDGTGAAEATTAAATTTAAAAGGTAELQRVCWR